MAKVYANGIPLDSISGNIQIIEPSHEAVHSGTHFTATWEGTTGTTLNTLITTGTAGTGIIHFVAEADGNKAFTTKLYEAPSATGGTVVTSYNNNRLSSNASPVSIKKNPTVTTVGTLLDQQRVGSNSPATKIGGGARHTNEWDLKASTKYLIRHTAVSAGTIIVTRLPYYYRK